MNFSKFTYRKVEAEFFICFNSHFLDVSCTEMLGCSHYQLLKKFQRIWKLKRLEL